MRPCVGLRNLVSRLKQVVLPAPLGPINAWIVPRSTRRLTSRTATKPANSLVRPSVSRTMSLAIERANSPAARLCRKLCGKGPGAGMPSRPLPSAGVRSSPPGAISTALVADEPQHEPIDAHVMPREQKMHRELVAGRDPPDQRLVRCGLHPAVQSWSRQRANRFKPVLCTRLVLSTVIRHPAEPHARFTSPPGGEVDPRRRRGSG